MGQSRASSSACDTSIDKAEGVSYTAAALYVSTLFLSDTS